MPAYVRLIIGSEGKVLKVVTESLYHPSIQTQDFLHDYLNEGDCFEFIDKEISDSEVLIVFHPDTYPCNHPLDPIEYDTDLVIDQIIVLQTNYKEIARKEIQNYLDVYSGCSTPPAEIETVIGEWEEIFDEDFYTVGKKEPVQNEDDPFCVYKNEWKNTYST